VDAGLIHDSLHEVSAICDGPASRPWHKWGQDSCTVLPFNLQLNHKFDFVAELQTEGYCSAALLTPCARHSALPWRMHV
jgi:hypothetical protein